MFVQFIRAQVGDEAAVRRTMERWEQELRPGADGFLGSTMGITTAGEMVAVARFASEEQARRNSDRPEQGAWWAELEKAFAGPASFLESADVDVSMGGGSNDAGFVQIMIGRGDRAAAAAANSPEAEAILRRERPDVIGSLTLWTDDSRFVDVIYFSSEADARAAEAGERSEEGRKLFEQFQQAMPVDEFLDLPDPTLS